MKLEKNKSIFQAKIIQNIKFIKLFFVLFFPFLYSNAQSPSDLINSGNLNEKYLEHLIKTKIDSVRQKHDCQILINDSILYLASKHHSKYMSENNVLSHYENKNVETKTPQLRAKYYGAKQYLVGENVLKTPFKGSIKNKKGKTIHIDTYGDLANAIVESWVNSSGHFKNMITPKFQITGLAIWTDGKNLYACQKFAKVQFKFRFEESKELFPYSEYQTPVLVNSFEGIKRELLDIKYPYGLRHDKAEECQECLTCIGKGIPYLTLTIRRNNFILRVENSMYIQNIIRNKYDGFAVEIVEYQDYACGNPEYYSKASRRNGQSKLNGKITQPLYRNDLYKGYKSRKKNPRVKFLKYLFSPKDVPFFKRFSQFKIDAYDSKYFEINLGKVPKDIDGYWHYNLLTIQNKQICHIEYFRSICGKLFEDSLALNLVFPRPKVTYDFQIEHKSLNFKVPFQKNKYTFSQKDIRPFIKSLNTLDYAIDSVNIQAFASIEGDAKKNESLQINRAKSIASVLQKHQKEIFPVKIKTETAWEDFYQQIAKNPRWESLSKMSQAELSHYLNSNPSILNDLENILSKERKALIDLYYSMPITDENMAYYINKEFKLLYDSLKRYSYDIEKRALFLQNFDKLYEFTYRKVQEKVLDADFLAKLKMPEYYEEFHPLVEKFVLYGHLYKDAFEGNNEWQNNHVFLRTKLIKDTTLTLSHEFIYLDCKIKTENLQKEPYLSKAQIQEVLDEMKIITDKYKINPKTTLARELDKMNFNLNMLFLNRVFNRKPVKNIEDAEIALRLILFYYEKEKLMTSDLAMKLAKLAEFYSLLNLASDILLPYRDIKTILAYDLNLRYRHISSSFSETYYDFLIRSAKSLSTEVWCNLFMGECNIPFQVFDHEELRNIFCEKCQGKNEFLKNIQKVEK